MSLLGFCLMAWMAGSLAPLARMEEIAGISRMRYAQALALAGCGAMVLAMTALLRPGPAFEAMIILASGGLGALFGAAVVARVRSAGFGQPLAMACLLLPPAAPLLAFPKARPGIAAVARQLLDGRLGILALCAALSILLALAAETAQALVRNLLSDQVVAGIRAEGGHAAYDGRTISMIVPAEAGAADLAGPQSRKQACDEAARLLALDLSFRIDVEGEPGASLLLSRETCASS